MKILLVILFITSNMFAQDSNILVTYVSKSPYFKGDLKAFIMNHIHYPILAQKDSIEGCVTVTFMIDTLGNTFNHTVISGIRYDLNQEALRVTRLIKFDAPGMQKDKPVVVKYIVPVEFKLKYNQEMVKDSACNCLTKIYNLNDICRSDITNSGHIVTDFVVTP